MAGGEAEVTTDHPVGIHPAGEAALAMLACLGLLRLLAS